MKCSVCKRQILGMGNVIYKYGYGSEVLCDGCISKDNKQNSILDKTEVAAPLTEQRVRQLIAEELAKFGFENRA